MAQSENQRLKLLYLVKIFFEQTDDDHGLSLKEIACRLNGYSITADRKTLYSDFELLRHFGFDIVSVQQGRDFLYHIGKRRFELPELKLLVDSVQSAKFLTEKKSNELISKLESLCSTYEAKHLHRQVFISGRIKTMNESIYYTIDVLHEAINANRQIRFHYYRWNTKKKMELRKNGAYYRVSPWSLMWDNEYYYLVAYDPEERMIKHYRVDKMLYLSIIDIRWSPQRRRRMLPGKLSRHKRKGDDPWRRNRHKRPRQPRRRSQSRSFCARSKLRLHQLPRTGRAVMNRPPGALSTGSNQLQIRQGKK